jgi:hypothetical protein
MNLRGKCEISETLSIYSTVGCFVVERLGYGHSVIAVEISFDPVSSLAKIVRDLTTKTYCTLLVII